MTDGKYILSLGPDIPKFLGYLVCCRKMDEIPFGETKSSWNPAKNGASPPNKYSGISIYIKDRECWEGCYVPCIRVSPVVLGGSA